MSRRNRRRRDQTDSRSRKAHKAARVAGERLPGVGLFLDGDPAAGGKVLRVVYALPYEAARARAAEAPEGMERLAFRWVAQPVWDDWRATHFASFAADAVAADRGVLESGGTRVTRARLDTLIDPVLLVAFSGPTDEKCPEGSEPDGLGGCREVR